MSGDLRPTVATLQRSARRHRELCYHLTDHSNVDEYTVAIARAPDAPATPAVAVDIVNSGTSIWPIVIDSQPVERLESTWASATPAVSGDLGDVTDIGVRPNKVQWRVHHVSQYGTPMVDAAVRLCWNFGARLHGCGAYIPRMWVDVPHCAVAWGVRLQLTAHVLLGRNVGSDRHPVAGLPVGVVGSITTPLGVEPIDWRVAIRGDGSTTRWWSSER